MLSFIKNIFKGTLRKACKKGDIEAVKQHLAAGADVNAGGVFGKTPLHLAAGRGHKEIVELLIANGADVNQTSDRGDTPLDFAEDIRAALGFKYVLSAKKEVASILRKHGGKTGEELKAEGK